MPCFGLRHAWDMLCYSQQRFSGVGPQQIFLNLLVLRGYRNREACNFQDEEGEGESGTGRFPETVSSDPSKTNGGAG